MIFYGWFFSIFRRSIVVYYNYKRPNCRNSPFFLIFYCTKRSIPDKKAVFQWLESFFSQFVSTLGQTERGNFYITL